MWEEGYDNAGGFDPSTQGGQTPGGGEKRKRAGTVTPVTIRNVLDCNEEGLKVEGLEVGIAVVVGKVINIQHSETKSTYTIEDDTGSIDAVMWKDETTGKGLDEERNTSEGQDLRVLGSVRTQSDKKYLMAFRLDQINGGQEEIDCHKLEIEHSKLIIRNMNEKENATIGANYGLSNSMVSSNSAPAANAGVGFGNPKQDAVYKMVKGCEREEGISRDELFDTLKSKMSKSDLDNALDYLSNEGHVYSTTDEDHFKTTDS